MKMKCLISIAIFMAAILTINAQPDQLRAKIDSIGSSRFPGNDPGGAICVVRSGKVLYKQTFGMSNLTYRIPVSDSTLFNLASVSKQFTAFLVMMLEEENKLALDDKLGKYLPEFTAFRDITLRQLLHHTSGIPSSDNLRLFAGLSLEMPWDGEDESAMQINYSKLNFKPGDEQNYSNANYFLLARVVEKVTGKSFREYIQERIFAPLGMKTATIYDSRGKIIPNLASGYRKQGDSYVEVTSTGESIYGSTNVLVSLDDIIPWLSNFTGPVLGSGKVFGNLLIARDTLNNGDTINYTGGLSVWKHRGLRIADHGGFTMGFKAHSFYVPDESLAISVISNNEAVDPREICVSVADYCLKDKLLPEEKKDHKEILVDKSLYKLYEGSYLMSDGQVLRFDNTGDTLLLIIPEAPKFVMYPEKENEFFLKDFDAQCTFVRGTGNKVNEIIWHQNGQNPHGIRYVAPKPLTASEMKTFAGQYENRALNVTYPVTITDGELAATLPKSFRMVNIDTHMVLHHTMGNSFYSSLGMIEFRRDKSGKIVSFTILDVGRLKNIDFTRRDK
jgi:CubicO group peptidase (beta-lactamase class C family)